MKVIYHCFGGSHSSVLAAALHLGIIDKTTLPNINDLVNLPIFDKTTDADFGVIRKVGNDEYGNEIYILGKKNLGDRYTKILEGIAYLLGVKEDLLAINVMTRVNWLMKIGGYLSRKMGLVRLGRYFLLHGTRQSFFEIVNLVEITKTKVTSKV